MLFPKCGAVVMTNTACKRIERLQWSTQSPDLGTNEMLDRSLRELCINKTMQVSMSGQKVLHKTLIVKDSFKLSLVVL